MLDFEIGKYGKFLLSLVFFKKKKTSFLVCNNTQQSTSISGNFYNGFLCPCFSISKKNRLPFLRKYLVYLVGMMKSKQSKPLALKFGYINSPLLQISSKLK